MVIAMKTGFVMQHSPPLKLLLNNWRNLFY